MVTELLDGWLRLFFKHNAREMKICLLIDMLNEFNGDHVEIIGYFKDIVDLSENV